MNAHRRSHLTSGTLLSVLLIFLLVAVAQEVAFAQGVMTNGGNHAGEISTPGEIDEWTFTAGLGDMILLRIGEVTTTPDPGFQPWIRLRFGSSETSNHGHLAAELSGAAPINGTYTVLVGDYGEFGGPGTALGHYQLHLVLIPGTPSVPANDQGGALTSGDNEAGSIHVGDMDPWTFEAVQGDTIWITVGEVLDSEVDPQFNPMIALYSPTGTIVPCTTCHYNLRSSGTLTATVYVLAPLAGTYTLVVSDFNVGREGSAVGDYVLHLVKVPGTSVVPNGDDGGPLISGANHAGRIGAPGATPTLHRGDLDTWTFTAAQNDAIIVSIGEVLNSEVDPNFNPRIDLYSPTGAFVAWRMGALTAEVSSIAREAGTYTVVVSDTEYINGGSAVGDYVLHLVKIPGASVVPTGDDGGAMISGANHTGRIGAPGATPTLHRGDLDVWTFTAAQNDAIIVTVGGVRSEVEPDLNPMIRLYSPTGAFVGSQPGTLTDMLSVIAPVAGTYTLVVSDFNVEREGSAVGDYVLHLVKVPGTSVVPTGDDGGPLISGANQAGRIGAPGVTPALHRGDLDVWTFTAAQNDAILLTVGEVLLGEVDPGFTPMMRLYSPTGVLVTWRTGALTAALSVVTPLSGTYTVVVSDTSFLGSNGQAVGDYVLHLVKIPGPSVVPTGDEGGAMVSGANHAGRIGAPGATPALHRGDLDTWTLTVAGGNPIGVNIREVLPSGPDPGFDPWIRLFDPTGSLVSSSEGVLNASINVTAATSGLYTLVVADSAINREGSAVGDYVVTATFSAPSVPTTAGDAYTTALNITLMVPAPGVLGNDTSILLPLTAELISTVTSGTLALNSNGSFTYTPPTSFTGTTSFTYRAVNAVGPGNSATVVITVASRSQPTTVSDAYGTNAGTPLNVAAPGVLGNDTSILLPLTAELISTVTSGTLALNSNGSFTYTPPTSFTGTTSFTYRAVNAVGPGNSATVVITVASRSQPTTVSDAYGTNAGTPLNVAAPGVLGNDTSNGGGALTSELIRTTLNGILVFNANGGFTYTPNAGFTGVDGFTYRAVSSAGPGNAASVGITVNDASSTQPPTGLYASSITGNIVTLRWSPPTSGAPPTGYVLEGGVNPGEILASIPMGGTNPIYTFPAPTGTFFVRVHTMSGANRSVASNEIRIFVNVPAAPSAPADMLGLVNGSLIALAWRNTFAGGAPGGIVLDVSGALTISLPLGFTDSFVFDGVPGGTYTLALRAVNAAGSSPSSNTITLTFPESCSGPPLPPSRFLAYRIGRAIFVQWDPGPNGPAPTSYLLNVTGAFAGNFATPGRSLNGAVGPGTYQLSVTAVNACGASSTTVAQTVVVP